MKSLLTSVYRNPRVRTDAYDIAKVIVGVIAAKYGLKLA